MDLYAYFGDEYASRAAYVGYSSVRLTTNTLTGAAPGSPVTTTTTVTTSTGGIGGYGSPFANNSGCNTEAAPTNQNTPSVGGTCAGDVRNIYEASLGFWHKFYNGPKGRVQWGIQYAYFNKTAWSGNNNVLTVAGHRAESYRQYGVDLVPLLPAIVSGRASPLIRDAGGQLPLGCPSFFCIDLRSKHALRVLRSKTIPH